MSSAGSFNHASFKRRNKNNECEQKMAFVVSYVEYWFIPGKVKCHNEFIFSTSRWKLVTLKAIEI